MTIYTRKELSQKYNIPIRKKKKKHDDLLDHLQDFMDIKEIKSESSDSSCKWSRRARVPSDSGREKFPY